MFLTKKSYRKILIMAICYFVIGTSGIVLGIVFGDVGRVDKFLIVLGILAYLLGVLFIFWGRYAEGKGKLINLGNKLVRKELKPAEFIKEYAYLKNSEELVIKKPSLEVLNLVIIAYDLLDDQENALATAEEMILAASEKKKTYTNLVKSSLLYAYDKKKEAEELFMETQKSKLDWMSNALVEAILKCDRAIAFGDYAVAEEYNLKMLERSFHKLDNLGKLMVHFKLGELYEKKQNNEKAIPYYQYCVNYGGETTLKRVATEKLQEITR